MRRKRFTLNYGDKVRYRGHDCLIVARDGNRVGFDGGGFYMPPDLAPEQIKSACVRIYRMLAKRDFTAKTLDLAAQMNVKPAKVKINGAKTRWGSCSAKGNINFSWRLVRADDDLIDYVIVHELAHLTEMNHSSRFWAIVESVMPDYRKRKARLRELQKQFDAENWEQMKSHK